MSYIMSFVIAIIIAIIGIGLFRHFKILDKPGADLKNTRKPVPTIQGIFVYISFTAIIAILFRSYFTEPIFLGLLIGSLPIVIIQILDEFNYIGKIKLKIPAQIRLISHIVGALLAVYISGIGNQEILIGTWKWIMPQYIFAIFFAIRSIVCINALNRFDGIYAQASGVSTIGFLTIFLLIKYVVFGNFTVFTESNIQMLNMIQNISFVLFSISLVSTIIEFKPLALLRDVGVMFFGFSLAYLSVVGGAKIGTLIVALSLVIFDAIRVGYWRIFVLKKSPLKGDYTHLHHRLLGLGWNRSEARAFVWIRSTIMMILILLQGVNRTNKLVIFVVMALVFFGINYYIFRVKKLQCGLNLTKNQ